MAATRTVRWPPPSRPASRTSPWSRAAGAARRSSPTSTSAMPTASACTRRPGLTSAPARRPRSRCRSLPRSSPTAARRRRRSRPTAIAMNEPFVAGLVLATGRSRTVGRPTPLLPYAGTTLLDYTLDTARACEFDQLLVVVDGAADKVRARVNLSGSEVVPTIDHAMGALDPQATVLVLLRCDQPAVSPAMVRVLLAVRGDA